MKQRTILMLAWAVGMGFPAFALSDETVATDEMNAVGSSAMNLLLASSAAPNVILSGMVARKHLRYFETRVPQHDRTTGEVSIKKWKLLKAAARSFVQTIAFAVRGGKGRI